MHVDLADLILAHPTTEWFALAHKPIVSTIEVRSNDSLVPVLDENSACSDAAFGGGGWSYNDNRRGIALTGDCTPFDGYEVTISYTADSVEAQ